MFQPEIFHETRVPVLHGLMAAHPFATLVTAAGALAADHLPFVLHPEAGTFGTLRGHIAANNPLSRAEGPIEALAIFQGPQAYVTPSWYASKAEHGKVVPTWNYVVVHARGVISLVREPGWLLAHLKALTDAHEGGRPAPWAVSDAPDAFVARQLRGIVGIEIEITSLDGTWKVSQNKAPSDRAGVVEGFAGAGGAEMAGLVADYSAARGT